MGYDSGNGEGGQEREELLSWKPEIWETRMGKKKVRGRGERDASKKVSKKGLESQVSIWELP